MTKEKIANLVLDSGAIIKGEPSRLYSLAETFHTVPGVVAEVRDERARARLDALPFALNVRTPSIESMAAVSAVGLCSKHSRIMSFCWMLLTLTLPHVRPALLLFLRDSISLRERLVICALCLRLTSRSLL